MRCFAPSDHALLTRAVEESLEHLKGWLAWAAHEPVSLDQRVEWLRTQRGQFDLDGSFSYGVFTKDERQLLGSAILRESTQVDVREVGFWIHVDHVGQGLATEVTSALVRVAFDLEELDGVELRCEPRNERSARVARKLGFAGPVLDPLSHTTDEGKIDMQVYSLSRVEYASSPLREFELHAYDVIEQRVL